MRRRLVVGNWKMHGTTASAESLVLGLVRGLEGSGATAEAAVCPPFVHVPLALQLTSGSALAVGAQDCSEYASGAYTGEVAGSMLADIGCRYVILGHSERRQYFGDSDERVAAKSVAARAVGLLPILCVGETLQEREEGIATEVVHRQLQAIAAQGLQPSDVIAYEPVWAIGTGRTATPQQAQEMHAFIRDFLRSQDAELAASIRLLYGGSVKAANAAELFAQADIDGGLVGGAALDAQEFIAIIEAE